MATSTLAVTTTFVAGTTADASQVNTNFTDIVDYINNRNDGTAEWQVVEVLATVAAAVVISGSAATTEVTIDNTATDGDSLLAFKIGGTKIITMGVDDSDSDIFKIGTTAITTAIAMQIPTTGAQVQFPLGSAGTPPISFIGDVNTGIYSAGADSVNFTTGGTGRVSIDTTSLQSNLPLYMGAGSNTAPSFSFASDTNTGMYSAAGDSINFTTAGTARMSIDATTIAVNIPFNPVGAGSISSGDASSYWNDISHKTLTDRGCLPYCDDGVELSDGRIVSDTEALLSIGKHPTKITIQGLPMLDYKTFPKKSYKKAEVRGVLLERDENDEPIGGSDGVEMTMMFGVFIGAIKELTNRVAVLENK